MNFEIEHDESHRLSWKVKLSKFNTKLKQDSFRIRGPTTFNVLPKDLRSLEGSMDLYKVKLDNFFKNDT